MSDHDTVRRLNLLYERDRLLTENQRLREALDDKTARLDIALGVFDDYDEARIDYESLVEYAEDEALAGDAE